jgi:tRNA (cytidine/uridine-2'-O-)-methyltransferase
MENQRPALALFQPDMPQNVGAAMRLCACLGLNLYIIEPCGFIWKEKEFKRSAMDYQSLAHVTRFRSWDHFLQEQGHRRIALLSTKSSTRFTDHRFAKTDILLMGQESKGAPDFVHERVNHRLLIPMMPEARSLNIVNAASLALGEALRQTNSYP